MPSRAASKGTVIKAHQQPKQQQQKQKLRGGKRARARKARHASAPSTGERACAPSTGEPTDHQSDGSFHGREHRGEGFVDLDSEEK